MRQGKGLREKELTEKTIDSWVTRVFLLSIM